MQEKPLCFMTSPSYNSLCTDEWTSATLSDDYRHRPDIIFYNRIRKTGSETTSKLFQEMSRRWRFSLVWDWKRPTRTLYMYDNSEEVGGLMAAILQRTFSNAVY